MARGVNFLRKDGMKKVLLITILFISLFCCTPFQERKSTIYFINEIPSTIRYVKIGEQVFDNDIVRYTETPVYELTENKEVDVSIYIDEVGENKFYLPFNFSQTGNYKLRFYGPIFDEEKQTVLYAQIGMY